MTAAAKHQTQKVGFDDLSGELRNKIYEYVLVDQNSLPIDCRWYTADQSPYIMQEPPLLTTSRRIRVEGLPIFYAENTFQSRDDLSLNHFLKRLGGKVVWLNTLRIRNSHPMENMDPVYYRDLHQTRIDVLMIKFGGQGLRMDTLLAPIWVEGKLVWLTLPSDKLLEEHGRCLRWKTAPSNEST